LPKTLKEYQLKIPSQSDNLAIIRDVVAKVASRVGFDTDEASKIELAVDEACTNVIKSLPIGVRRIVSRIFFKLREELRALLRSNKA